MSNAQTGSPCYTIVHSRHGQWEMVPATTNKLVSGSGVSAACIQQTSQQTTGNIIVTTGGNASNVLPSGGQVIEPHIVPDFVINQQSIVVPKSN